MSIHVKCPNCSRSGRVPQDYDGLPVRCPDCGAKFKAKNPTTGDVLISKPFFGPGAEQVDAAADMPDTVGRFQIKAWLGRGGFGDVYLAFDPVLERDVALKVPRAKTLSNPDRVARFLLEAKSAARLRHPHIVPVFDSGQDGDRYYIAAAFIEGNSLDDALMAKRPIDFVRIATLIRALAEALAYAHSQGIVHRDIKPANIMLDGKGAPYLVDFGLAARLDGSNDTDHASDDAPDEPVAFDADPKMTQLADPHMTVKRVRMGTPSYWSPEQAAGLLENVKAPTDQYSLGMVLYEMLCGHPAFSGPPPLLQALAQKSPPPPPRGIKPEIPEDLEAICLKTLAKRPEDRYPSCQELADDLRRWLEGEETHTRPLPTKERVKRWCKKEPMRAWALGLACVAVLAVLVLSIVFGVQESRSAKRIGAARDLADRNRKEAEANAELAKSNERETKIRLAEFALHRAQMYGEQQETGLAMSWLARSLELADEAGAPGELKSVIRRNFFAWKQAMHALRVSTPVSTKVHAVLFHPGEPRLYLGGEDSILHGSITRGEDFAEERAKLDWPKSPVRALAHTPDDGKIVMAIDKKIIQTDANFLNRKELHVGEAPIVALATTPGLVAFVDANHKAWLRNLSTDNIQRLDKNGNVLCLAFSPLGDAIVMGCKDGARMWSRVTESEDGRIGVASAVQAVAYHPDGKRLVLARSTELSGQAELWSVAERRKLKDFHHQAEVHAVAFSPCGQILVTASRDRSARLWHVDSHQSLGRTLWHPAEVTHAVFHPIKQGLVTVDSKKTVRLWELKQEDLKPAFEPSLLPITAVSASADDKSVLLAPAVAPGDPVRVQDAKGALIAEAIDPCRALVKPGDYSARVTAFALGADGRMLLASMLTRRDDRTSQKFIVQWVDKKGIPQHTFYNHTDAVIRVAISPDGKTLASAGRDGRFFVWNAQDGTLLLESPQNEPYGKLFALAYSRDGEKLVVGGTDQFARINDLQNPKDAPVRLPHPDSVLSAAFSRDQRSFLLIGFAGGAQLWDRANNAEQPLQHMAGVFAVAFSPDGKTMVTAGTDRQARFWDRATRQPIGPPLKHPRSVFTATLTNTTLITATFPSGDFKDTTVHQWPIPGEEPLDDLALRAKLISNLDLDRRDTNNVLDGATWHKLNKQVKHREDWQKGWPNWPAQPLTPSAYPVLQPKKELLPKAEPPKEKLDPDKTPENKVEAILWKKLDIPASKDCRVPEGYYPKFANLVQQIDLDQIRTSPWAMARKESLAKIHPIVKVLMEEIAKVIDISSVDRISVAMEKSPDDLVLVVEGRFEKLRASAKAAPDSVPSAEVANGIHLALVSDKVLVAASDPTALKKSLLRGVDSNRRPLPPELVDFRAKANAKVKPCMLLMVKSELGQWLANGDPRQKQVAAILSDMELLMVSVTMQKNIDIHLNAKMKDADTAMKYAGLANILVAAARAKVAEEAKTNKDFAPLVEILNTVRVSATGSNVVASGHLTFENLDAILNKIPMSVD